MSATPRGESRITRNAGVFAVGTLASRLTGFVRDAAIVAVFGSALADLWFLAWTLPNALRRLVGEGSVTIAFVPIFSGRLREGEGEARRFLNLAFTAASLLLLALVVAGVAAMTPIIDLLAGSWDEATRAQTVHVARWAFPYLFFIGLVAVAMGALNTLGRFFVPAVSQALLNLCLIAGALLGARLVEPGLLALAWSALAGGLLQLGANLLDLRAAGYMPRPRLDVGDAHLKRLGLLMAPATLGASIHQINLLVSRAFAASVGPGSITWLYSANILVELPLGLFAVSLAVASLPALSGHAKAEDWDAWRDTLNSALRQVLYVTVPAAAGLAALAVPTVAVVFQRGAFGAADATATADALWLYALGLPAIGAVRLVVQGFYSLEDTRTPVLVGAISVAVFVTAALLLMPGMGHRGIALASSLTAYVNLTANLLLLRRRAGRLGLSAVLASLLKTLVGAAATFGVAWAVARLGRWEAGAGSLDADVAVNVGVLALAVAAGIGCYAAVTLGLGSREAKGLLAALRRRLSRGR